MQVILYMKKVGIVCCSNGIEIDQEKYLLKLENELKNLGVTIVWSPYIYKQDGIRSADAEKRAKVLMDFCKDEEIDAVFDISGGDIANEILEYIDFHQITKMFWGYSDLTTILNAIYSQTQKQTVLFQIRNLIDNELQIQRIKQKTLFQLDYQMLQGKMMKGIVVGGNIRCFLKLAGTIYFPNVKDKLLLLEAYSGDEAKLITYFSQLKQMKVFDKIQGLIIGTYTEYFQNHELADLIELVKRYIPNDLPIIYTKDIGHSKNAKAIVIGKEYIFVNETSSG